MSLPADYTPKDLDDAKSMIGTLLGEIKELRKQRGADDKEMSRIVEVNSKVVDQHNENVEAHRVLKEQYEELRLRFNKIVEDLDSEAEERAEKGSKQAWEELRKEGAKLEERELEVDAREAILRKRYGSGQPRGRPAEYSEAQLHQVRDLQKAGMNMAAVAREMNLTARQVRHAVKHRLPSLPAKSQHLRMAEYTALFTAFEKQIRKWAKTLPDHRKHRHLNILGKGVKKGAIFLNTAPYDLQLRSYLAADFEPGTPARVVLAAEKLRRWMKVNETVVG